MKLYRYQFVSTGRIGLEPVALMRLVGDGGRVLPMTLAELRIRQAFCAQRAQDAPELRQAILTLARPPKTPHAKPELHGEAVPEPARTQNGGIPIVYGKSYFTGDGGD